MHKPVFPLLLSVSIAFLTLGCQGALQPPNATPTLEEGWHLYVDPVYGITFEYPESLDREPLIWNCGISNISETSISFGAVSSMEIKETRTLDLEKYADQFIREHADYKIFSTNPGVNESGLALITIEYSMGAPYADHLVTIFANENYVVELHHYFRAPICITETPNIDDFQIYNHAVASLKFP